MTANNHFSYDEIACRCGCGFDVVAASTLEVANAVREFLGYPVWGSSTCRCVRYNNAIDPQGSPESTHLPWWCALPATIGNKGQFRPVDPQMASLGMDLNFRPSDVPRVIAFIKKKYPLISIGGYHWGCHIDSGKQHGHPARFQRALWGLAA